jgi:hypothetical protein
MSLMMESRIKKEEYAHFKGRSNEGIFIHRIQRFGFFLDDVCDHVIVRSDRGWVDSLAACAGGYRVRGLGIFV